MGCEVWAVGCGHCELKKNIYNKIIRPETQIIYQHHVNVHPWSCYISTSRQCTPMVMLYINITSMYTHGHVL